MRCVINTLTEDSAARDADGQQPTLVLIGLYCGLTLAADGCVQAQGACWGRLSYEITQRVSLSLFERLHALSLRWHLNRKTGEVLSVMNTGIGAVASLLQVITFSISATVIELLLTSAVFAKIGVPAISACVVVGAALYAAYTVCVTRQRNQERRRVNGANKKAQDAVVDSLLNFETVKLFACEAAEAQRYGGLTRDLSGLQVVAQDSLSLLNWGQTGTMQLGMAGGLLVAGVRASVGDMSVGDFVMVQLYITQLFKPLANLGGNYRTLTQALTDVQTMAELLSAPIEVVDAPGAADLREVLQGAPRETRDVVFRDVGFRYELGGAGVEHLSLTIPPGGSVALVGPSGSGKSTSTRLLCRLLEVQSGSVSIGGVDVRSVTQHSLRSVVSTVSQDTVLFNASLRYNLTYGARGASEAQMSAALSLARADAFVGRMPNGLETPVGERGLRLSGGEKQRLGIARAVLREPTVLILDEATSALDTETEREVQAALDAAAANQCTLMIAHRLSTVVGCNEIVVLRDGFVVERGTHDVLLAAPHGLYASMWGKQADAQSEARQQGGELSCHGCKCCVETACDCCATEETRARRRR